MIIAWRICKARMVRSAFSGEGAFLHGGRWNSPGVKIVYAAGSQSLAALEMLVHLDNPTDLVTLKFVAVPVEIEDPFIEGIARLPKDWMVYPAPPATARVGDDWIASGRSCVLKVPSAVIRSEWNFLINPAHPNFPKLRIGRPVPFRFDARLA